LSTGPVWAGGPGIETVVRTPGLVAFWTFGEPAGQLRLSTGTPQGHPLQEVGGPIPRVPGGPFSGYAAESMTGEATIGAFGGLAVFNRALTDAEMKQLHAAADVEALIPGDDP